MGNSRAQGPRLRAAGCAALFWIGVPALGAQTEPGTPEVFRRYAGHVVKVQIVEESSGAKAEVGSAFAVSPRGHLITNYHVVAKVVHDPARYRAELVDRDGAAVPVRIEAVNVVDDLAVVSSGPPTASWFRLGPVSAAHGARLYSIGNPRDLGIAIVEGTHNGLLRHTLYPRIHFTGPLTPGMSGGPTITPDGDVVGVNVATAGDEVSFLVPVDRAAALLAIALAPGYRRPADFLQTVAAQLLAYQDAYVGTLFQDGVDSVELGPYRVPTQPAPFFNCWADAERDPEDPYAAVSHQCATDDYVYVSRDHSSGTIEFRHRVLESRGLNRFGFAALVAAEFGGAEWVSEASEEDVTAFRCRTRNVDHGGVRLRAGFCLRRHRKLVGLYDAVLRAATLGGAGRALITTLTLSGVSRENAERVTRRYLERIAWTGR